MQNRRMGLLFSVFACGVALLWMGAQASADEIQLGGIRLGQHALHVIQVFGQPDGVLKGEGQASAAAGAQGAGGQMMGAGPGAGGAAGGAGAGPGMPGGMGGPQGAGGMGPGGGAARGGGAGGGMGPGAPGGMGPGGAGGPQGGGMGMIGGQGGAGGATAALSQNWFYNVDCPDWAAPVWLPTQGDEVLYVYRRGTVVIGFLLDRDGYVGAIAVAGRSCNWARTAMGAPKRTIKLGDTYRSVLQRYGNPTRTTAYEPIERYSPSGTGEPAPTIGGGYLTGISRDIILHYGYNDNIEFTLQDMKVVRIHIWQPDLREPEARNAGAAAGGQGGAGMMGQGAGMGGAMGGPGGGGGQGRQGAGPMGPGGGGPR